MKRPPFLAFTSVDLHPKDKFLFLAYRDIADSDIALKHFSKAEHIYQRLFDYIPVWPGTDDSDYPINFESIGMARMGQQRWKEAEEPLLRAVSIFDKQIDLAGKSKSEFVRKHYANTVRMSEDYTLNALAVVYFREGRAEDALETAERAYNQAVGFQAPARVLKQVVDVGRSISLAVGDADASAKWSQRSTPSR